MTRDEIYEHLAKVYIGKKESLNAQKPKPKANKAWWVMNGVITIVLVMSVVYGFTAFFSSKKDVRAQIIYALNSNPVKIKYNLNAPFASTKKFVLNVPQKDVSKFHQINFKVRGHNGGYPGVIKLQVSNSKNEKATYYVKNVDAAWQEVVVPFDKLNITDWSAVTEVAFILEAWNVDYRQGVLLIDDISFSN